MKVAMIMSWNGVTTNQYDTVRKIVDWEGNPADGGLFHIAAHDGTALRVTDVWESPEKFNTFVNTRLMPGVAQAGITTEPMVEVLPLHALFTPGFKEVTA